MYSIAVKIDGIENKKRSVSLLHIFAGFYLLIKTAEYGAQMEETSISLVLLILIVALLSLGYGFFRKRLDSNGKYNLRLRLLQVITLAVFGITSIRTSGSSFDNIIFLIWAALFLIMLLLERKIFSDTDLILKVEGIQVPGIYTDQLLFWEQMEDIVIRHDFVTIFKKNKKYLQYQVLQNLSELELAKMNAYCREKIEMEKARNNSIKN